LKRAWATIAEQTFKRSTAGFYSFFSREPIFRYFLTIISTQIFVRLCLQSLTERSDMQVLWVNH